MVSGNRAERRGRGWKEPGEKVRESLVKYYLVCSIKAEGKAHAFERSETMEHVPSPNVQTSPAGV